jgi:hypothetical protein
MRTADFPTVREARAEARKQMEFYNRMMGFSMTKYIVDCYKQAHSLIFTETVEAPDAHTAKHMVNEMAIKQGLHPVHFEVWELKK